MPDALIAEIFNAFDPHQPLRANDPRYVECSAERNTAQLLDSMAQTIRLSNDATSQLFSGHRGSGKTTELYRLQNQLQTGEGGAPYFTVYCESDDYITVSDVEYTDVLLAIVQQIWIDTRKAGIDLAPGKIGALLDDLAGMLFSDVDLKKLDIDAKFVKLGFEVKRNPDNRARVRGHLRPRATSFLDAINEVIADAREKLQNKGYRGLVVIVDNLDRIPRDPVPNVQRNRHDVLFIEGAEYLRGLRCHTIYTIPPAVLYSTSGPQVSALFGNVPNVLPMIPVSFRARSGENTAGISKIVEIIERRVRYLRGELLDAFDSQETVQRLATASAGYERLLMTLVQSARTYVPKLPITRDAAETAIQRARQNFTMSIRTPEKWRLLREVAKNKQIGESDEYMKLLEGFAILQYLDSEGYWYDVSPIIRESREFA